MAEYWTSRVYGQWIDCYGEVVPQRIAIVNTTSSIGDRGPIYLSRIPPGRAPRRASRRASRRGSPCQGVRLAIITLPETWSCQAGWYPAWNESKPETGGFGPVLFSPCFNASFRDFYERQSQVHALRELNHVSLFGLELAAMISMTHTYPDPGDEDHSESLGR